MRLKQTIFIYSCLPFIILFSSCSTPVQMPDASVPSIVLKEAQTRELSPAGTISVPAGIYTPDFEANNGIYYRAPGHLIGKALGMSFIQRGGIFVPNPLTEQEKADIEAEKSTPKRDPTTTKRNAQIPKQVRDLRQGVWYDQQEGSGGLLISAVTSPKVVHHVKPPFIFEVQTNQNP